MNRVFRFRVTEWARGGSDAALTLGPLVSRRLGPEVQALETLDARTDGSPTVKLRCIRYRSGYKYQLRQPHVDSVAIHPDAPVSTEYVSLTLEGTLTIRRGYAWDGPSGPSIDTPSFMRGSLVHDALYQLMRLEALDAERWRDKADRELQRMCREDGMWRIRAWWVYLAVHWFGEPATSPSASKPVEVAPKACSESA